VVVAASQDAAVDHLLITGRKALDFLPFFIL